MSMPPISRRDPAGQFPAIRQRRLRHNTAVRRLVREQHLHVDDLIQPIFVRHGEGVCQPIASMPGCYQYSLDQLPQVAEELAALDLQGVMLFGIPAEKDAIGSDACDPEGIIAQAIRLIKQTTPQLYVIADVCCCEYTDHGHCGVLAPTADGCVQTVDNDATLAVIAQQAVNFAAAGADCVAPSGMMDGMVEAIRHALDQPVESVDLPPDEGITDPAMLARMADPEDILSDAYRRRRGILTTSFSRRAQGVDSVAAYDAPQSRQRYPYRHVTIMSYAVKYASALYGPFRDAAEGSPQLGDRRGYQMDPANGAEALEEARMDISQGADFIIVKPALSYLDVIAAVHAHYPHVPIVAYQVSGEYAMIKAAAAQGWLPEQQVVWESLVAMKRAGARCIITYFAKTVAEQMAQGVCFDV